MDDDLQSIIELARSGNRDKARRLLMRRVRKNPQDALAWYKLSFIVEKQEQKIDCLQYVLKLRPRHSHARHRLQQILSSATRESQNDKGPTQPFREESVQTKATTKSNSPTTTPKNKEYPPSLGISPRMSEENIPSPKAQLAIQPNSKIPTIPKHASQLWLIDERESNYDNQPDILQFFFDDIAQCPIITSPHQELWLGIHLRSIDRLQAIHASRQSNTNSLKWPEILWQLLFNNWRLLEKGCFIQELPAPKLEGWAVELLAARSDIYKLRRSRVRRFIRRVQGLVEEAVKEQILAAVYVVVETLAILPRKTVATLIDFINNHARLPELNETENWLSISQTAIKQQVQRRAKETKHTLTTGYLRYALRVAQGYVGQGLDFGDLVQAGFMGLMRAAEKFDYRVQARFGVYATSWIWQSIGREIANQGRTIRLPAHLQENLRKWTEACEQFDDGYQDTAHNTNILFHAGLLKREDYELIRQRNRQNKPITKKVAKRYREAVKKAQKMRSYSATMFSLAEVHVITRSNELSDIPNSLINCLPDDNPLPEVETDVLLIRSAIEEQVFPLLTERECEILQLRCGWIDGEERTLEEIGGHYGLTRERIRQIEAKALKKLNSLRSLGRLPYLFDLIPDHTPVVNWDSGWQLIPPPAETTDTEKLDGLDPLDTLMDQLPRSDWVKGRSRNQVGQRREQLATVLNLLATPSHVADITEQINEIIDGQELESSHIYNLLMRYEETFISLGQGIFSLVHWEQARAKEPQPILPCCPMPLPDPPDYEDAFFESVLVGQQALAENLTVGRFIRYMLNWSKSETDQQKWFMQSILSAYYLVDLIPYTFYFGGDNAVLSCTLPAGTIQDLRYHCLKSLTKRLIAMPEFWWLLQQQQPARPVDLSDLFVDMHPAGLDDVLQRLRLLASLGAAQKSRYGEYRLTPLGEECANQWKKEPTVETVIDSETNLIYDFAGLATW